jgi:hypothetical protein
VLASYPLELGFDFAKDRFGVPTNRFPSKGTIRATDDLVDPQTIGFEPRFFVVSGW